MSDVGSFIHPKNTPYVALSNRPYQWYLTPYFYLKMEKQSTSKNDTYFQSRQWTMMKQLAYDSTVLTHL